MTNKNKKNSGEKKQQHQQHQQHQADLNMRALITESPMMARSPVAAVPSPLNLDPGPDTPGPPPPPPPSPPPPPPGPEPEPGPGPDPEPEEAARSLPDSAWRPPSPRDAAFTGPALPVVQPLPERDGSEDGEMTTRAVLRQKEVRRRRAAICTAMEKVLSNLGVVADLKVGERLRFSPTGDFEIQPPSVTTSLYRLLTGANRNQTFEQVSMLLGTAESMVDEGSVHDPRMREALVKAVYGMRNLQKTYAEDRTFRNRLDVLIQRVTLRYAIRDPMDLDGF
jgi:hypothetical protein